MLAPKRILHRKVQRGSMKGQAKGNTELHFGEFGIQALEAHWITNRQIEAAEQSYDLEKAAELKYGRLPEAKKQLEETKALPDAEIGKPADDTADLTAKNAPKDNNAAAAAAAEQESTPADPAKSGTDALQPKQKNTMDQKRSKRYVKGNQKK